MANRPTYRGRPRAARAGRPGTTDARSRGPELGRRGAVHPSARLIPRVPDCLVRRRHVASRDRTHGEGGTQRRCRHRRRLARHLSPPATASVGRCDRRPAAGPGGSRPRRRRGAGRRRPRRLHPSAGQDDKNLEGFSVPSGWSGRGRHRPVRLPPAGADGQGSDASVRRSNDPQLAARARPHTGRSQAPCDRPAMRPDQMRLLCCAPARIDQRTRSASPRGSRLEAATHAARSAGPAPPDPTHPSPTTGAVRSWQRASRLLSERGQQVPTADPPATATTARLQAPGARNLATHPVSPRRIPPERRCRHRGGWAREGLVHPPPRRATGLFRRPSHGLTGRPLWQAGSRVPKARW